MALKIAIDGISVSHPQPGGYHTYATNLVRALARIDQVNEYWLLTDRPVNWDAEPNWHVVKVPAPCGGPGIAWREQVALPHEVARLGVHLLHMLAATGPLFCKIPLVATIHDTIELTDPLPSPLHTKRWAMRLYSRRVQEQLARRAKRIITVSEHSRRQIMARYSLPAERVTAIHEAPSAIYHATDRARAREKVKQTWGISGHVLSFASAAPRKNTVGLMKAYAQLGPRVREEHPLLLVCTHEEQRAQRREEATRLGILPNLTLLVCVSDQDLLLLYNAARLFVFPSLEEGFGLPPLEAMACGTPVVASNTSSLPEVLGGAALLVTPTDICALAEAMAAVLTTPTLAEDLAQRGLVHSKQFSWEATARQTLALYESVAAKTR